MGVAEASAARAPIQKLVDWWAAYFVPVVVHTVATFAVGSGRPAAPPWPTHYNAVRAHHRLSLARTGHPMSIMVATGKAATVGVLSRMPKPLTVMRQSTPWWLDRNRAAPHHGGQTPSSW